MTDTQFNLIMKLIREERISSDEAKILLDINKAGIWESFPSFPLPYQPIGPSWPNDPNRITYGPPYTITSNDQITKSYQNESITSRSNV